MIKQTFFSLIFGLLVLGSYQNAFAQISVGIRGGVLLTNLDIDPLQEGEPKPENITGYQVAIPVEIGIVDIFAIQAEIMYGSHGARQEGSSTVTQSGFTTVTDYKLRSRINTLEIPVLAKLRFGDDALKFHVLAGPSFGFGINGKFKQEGSVLATAPDGTILLDQNLNEEYNAKFVKENYNGSEVADEEIAVTKTNLNLHMGAGISFDLGGTALFLDARYMLGLSDLSPEEDGTPKENETTAKSRRIGVSVGVMFPLN